MANRYTFDTAYLRALTKQRINIEELARKLGIRSDKLELLLSGKAEFRYYQILDIARILDLTVEEFERCFFMLLSSEKLN